MGFLGFLLGTGGRWSLWMGVVGDRREKRLEDAVGKRTGNANAKGRLGFPCKAKGAGLSR